MATFKFGRQVNIHWNGFEVVGPAETVFSIPDQLYEEFEGDFRHVEPSLTWIDTNEFQTLENQVSTAVLSATFPVAIATSTSGKTISLSSSTNPNGYLLTADGSGGVIFTPASTSGLTSVVGISPISTIITGGTVSVSLTANYQTAGTYVTSVIGSSPVSASGTTAITVSIDQTALSVADASTASTVRTYVKNASGSTITKGQVVYITGADGTNALISLASASTDATSSKTLGIAANTMTNNAFGYVIENGQLSNIDTSAATAGSSVWLGTTPGSLVFNSPPAEPNHFVYLGVVTKANASTGEILVKVQNGYELNELHDVFTTGVSTSLPLVYNATSDGWIAQALSSVGIADDAIVTSKILDSAVTSTKIAAGAVGSAAIGAGAINSTHIGANAVVAGDIAANAVTSGNIAAGAVGSSQLADNAVVAAKIAANAVGITKIDSGSATSGQVLTANGSSGVSFTTLQSGGLSVATLSAVSNNTIPNHVQAWFTSVNVQQQTRAIAYDSVNNHVYIAGSTTTTASGLTTSQVYKVDAATGSQLASVSISMSTVTTNNELIIAAAWGSDRLCLLTNSSVSTVAPVSRWFILNSSLSTLATGNVHSVAQGAENRTVTTTAGNFGQRAFVRYDKNANQFVISHASNTGTTNAGRLALYRIVDASTYTTGYYTFPATVAIGASTVSVATNYLDTSVPSQPVYVPSLSRWVSYMWYSAAGSPNTPNLQVISFSQSTTTTAIFSIAGRQTGLSTNTVSDGNAFRALVADDAGTTLYGGSPSIMIKISVSDISANINTNSSAGVLIRSTNSYKIGNGNGGLTGAHLKYLKNGSDEWLVWYNNLGGYLSLVAHGIWANSGSVAIDIDPSKNFYSLISKTSTTDPISSPDDWSTPNYPVTTTFDIGANNGIAYAISSGYWSTDNKQVYVRITKLGDCSKKIINIHNTSDPLTEISISSYTNSDTSTPVSNGYMATGMGNLGDSLSAATFTGTYWKPQYAGTTNNHDSYVMEPGSSAFQYIGASTTSASTNTTTVKVLRKR